MSQLYSIITGTGRYIPSKIVKNEHFIHNEFFNASGERNAKANEDIIQKFQQITEIEERRYVENDLVASDIGFFAAEKAIENAQIDKETLDYIIVAHNFGDVLASNKKSDLVPSLAARIKHKLGIKNPETIAYDLPFGCPGWLQAVIQADYYIKSGDAHKILVIGTETLSRISDPHDIDSMIYSDGAGAVILEAKKASEPVGILKHKTRSDTFQHALLLKMDVSYNPDFKDDTLFLKMEGRKLYEYALQTVPQLVKDCIDKAGLDISDIKKVLIHQANAKMDYAILARLLKLYGLKHTNNAVMPMTIAKLGNNSVATLPVLFDLLMKHEIEHHEVKSGDYLVFASVGAGMNVNAVIYKMP
jgi:3-oxoacyl-[acyl-carrier-protein] synthase III